MNRWAAIGILGGFSLAAPFACQSPDTFLRPAGGGGVGGHGLGGSGLGGFFSTGTGGNTGLGGRGTGGTFGLGGATGAGGRGAGGSPGGAGMTGRAGTTGTAGTTGDAGVIGAGGRVVDAGSSCVATLINNGYAAGTAIPCSMCIENTMSRAQLCMDIIDCIAPLYPCTGCFTDCSNTHGGSGPVMDCVKALMTAACSSN